MDYETSEYFLVLCGGGMDLSQDIALAYLILEKWIPEELLRRVISQKAFSISEKNFKRLKEAIIEQAEVYKIILKEQKRNGVKFNSVVTLKV